MNGWLNDTIDKGQITVTGGVFIAGSDVIAGAEGIVNLVDIIGSGCISGVILVIVVVVAGVLIWDHESRVEYTVNPGTSSEMLDTVMFTVSADLDEAATVTLWCDGEKLSTVLNVSEWTAPAGSWEQTFWSLFRMG